MRIRTGLLGSGLALLLAGCGPSPVGPSGASPKSPQASSSKASADDLAIGGGGAFPIWNVGGAEGDFRVHPMGGAAPLDVHVNMCHSSDPAPGISLHFHVTWGDGADDHGFCRFDHTFSDPGTFTAQACVWDEIPAHAPGVCDTFTLTIEGGGTRHAPPSPPPLCHSITATLPETNTAAACPTSATQFCSVTPLVATNADQAKAACEACYGVGRCTADCGSTRSCWAGASRGTLTGFSFASIPTCSITAGSIGDTCAASTLRWSP